MPTNNCLPKRKLLPCTKCLSKHPQALPPGPSLAQAQAWPKPSTSPAKHWPCLQLVETHFCTRWGHSKQCLVLRRRQRLTLQRWPGVACGRSCQKKRCVEACKHLKEAFHTHTHTHTQRICLLKPGIAPSLGGLWWLLIGSAFKGFCFMVSGHTGPVGKDLLLLLALPHDPPGGDAYRIVTHAFHFFYVKLTSTGIASPLDRCMGICVMHMLSNMLFWSWRGASCCEKCIVYCASVYKAAYAAQVCSKFSRHYSILHRNAERVIGATTQQAKPKFMSYRVGFAISESLTGWWRTLGHPPQRTTGKRWTCAPLPAPTHPPNRLPSPYFNWKPLKP